MSFLSGVLLNLFLVITSYSFFMLVLSCWYFYRDKNEGKIKFASLLSVVISLAYSVYKFIAVYPLGEMGTDNTGFVNFQAIQYAFCIQDTSFLRL